MNGVLTLLAILLSAAIILVVPLMPGSNTVDWGPATVTVFDAIKAILLCAVCASIAGLFCYRHRVNGLFLLRIFMAALLIRMLVGTLIFIFNGQDFFGGDALTYDYNGFAQLRAWGGDHYYQAKVTNFIGVAGNTAWGMIYFVAVVYSLVGRNMLAIQFINSILGAATAPLIFVCAYHVFNNLRVARVAAFAVAFYPSLVLWSSQALKDGPIVFFLALSILATLKLGERISTTYLIALVCSLFAILTLRFYVFYMITVAIGGALAVGMRALTATTFLRQFLILIILGMALTYLGINRYASVQIEGYGNLERVQRSRRDLAVSAKSGFGKDVDVSTTKGALSAVPLGLLYLLFAPFPWQIVSLRQSITLPEMVMWWTSFPMLILGLWFSIKYRLRMISPILIFTAMLSIAYSILQGNVGTAYRQRAQLLVFYFIFVAVGFVLLWERREKRKRQEFAQRLESELKLTTLQTRPARGSQ